MCIVIFLFIGLIGFIISLIILHKYHDKLDISDYDDSPDYIDDWDSNATAYLSFSLVWPLFWTFQLIFFIGKSLSNLSKFIQKKVNGNIQSK